MREPDQTRNCEFCCIMFVVGEKKTRRFPAKPNHKNVMLVSFRLDDSNAELDTHARHLGTEVPEHVGDRDDVHLAVAVGGTVVALDDDGLRGGRSGNGTVGTTANLLGVLGVARTTVDVGSVGAAGKVVEASRDKGATRAAHPCCRVVGAVHQAIKQKVRSAFLNQ